MAKTSKVNVSFTGDSRGIVKASDDASNGLRKVRMEAEKTRQQFDRMKANSNQAAEAISKFGVAARPIQAAGGLFALGAMGGMGTTFAGIGLGLMYVQRLSETYDNLATNAEAARKVQEKFGQSPALASEFRKAGFTEAGGRALAALDVRKPMTFAQAESQTIARIRAQGIEPSGLSDVIRLGPAALGVMSGAFVEGQIPEAEDFAASMGKGEANNFLRGLSYFSIVGNIMRIAGDWQRVAESR